MSAKMSAMPPTQYRPSSRSWIKLWVNEWLTGTVRWQLTPQQRSIWADLLALAGRSRFPGVVCSGETNNVLDPFPIDYLCSVFRCTQPDVEAAFALFKGQSRIAIDSAGVIFILNWEKYQSEYQQKRQRKTYKNAAESISNVRTKSAVEGEVEVEVEVEGEGEGEGEKEGEAEAEATVAAFAAISCKPFGGPKFKEFWTNEYRNHKSGNWADAMEHVIELCQANRVKVPGRFFAHKREIEKIEAERAYRTTPL